jgi:hypothetical protein
MADRKSYKRKKRLKEEEWEEKRWRSKVLLETRARKKELAEKKVE